MSKKSLRATVASVSGGPANSPAANVWRIVSLLASVFVLVIVARAQQTAAAPSASTPTRRNVIIFVADGLRAGSVNPQDAPTLWAIRQHGVNFVNSHSLYPTLTTPNASAIATGHLLGDTGDFGNTLWAGYPVFESGNFNMAAGSPTPFL
jgi:hypothetical protein